jgi:hypothetical protein
MQAVTFNDNLYGLHGIEGGCGLKGYARVGFWHYSRHDPTFCKPGMWAVGLHGGSHMGSFWDLCPRTHAVVDDFGDLVRVQ